MYKDRQDLLHGTVVGSGEVVQAGQSVGPDGQRPPGAIVAQQVVDRIAGTDVLIELGGLADKRAESSSKHRCAKILSTTTSGPSRLCSGLT
jgi:hypothetical protein